MGPLTPGSLSPTPAANVLGKKIGFSRSGGSQPPDLSLSTELRELSAVSDSKPAKVCAPRISFFEIYVVVSVRSSSSSINGNDSEEGAASPPWVEIEALDAPT